jgi:serine/threonine protein kinase/beta-lactam-binding protein with PASTA domain
MGGKREVTGKILGNRYEILEEIGNGGMAHVYKAKCMLLNRFVAVKILRSEFVSDEEFLARFNAEAQAAAALSHPNIVSIYDVGREGNIEYIVMEYVEGKTLKEYIRENKLLPWRQAVDFAIQIASALNCAHKKGIIHRDIKPQNIMLAADGVLKVTDFGIARAASSSSVTITGSAMGSVHYLSPEQARGGYTDAKSDIYSLGIVMYEMVTGKLPFDGENPVTVAIKQIQEKPVSPRDYNLAVPLSVEKIILRAMDKDQNMRYQTTLDMLGDLEAVRINPEASLSPQLQDTEGATKKIPAVKPEQLHTKIIEDEKNSAPPEDKAGQKKDEEGSKMNKAEKKAVIWAVITSVAIVAALIVGAMAVIFPDMLKGSAKDIQVPSLVGESFEDVKDLYEEQGISVKVEGEQYSDEYSVGEIIFQDPKAGRLHRLPFTINVIVSKGNEEFILDDYSKRSFIDTKIDLEDKNIVVEEVEQESEDIPQNMVIKTVPPAKSKVKAGNKVTVFVSTGIKEKPVIVPSLEGFDIQQARKILSENKLGEPNVKEVYSDKEKGVVVKQSIPASTEVREYTVIELEVSKGPELRTKDVDIRIPQEKNSTHIKILQDGVTIHDQTHYKSEGTAFGITISGRGKVVLELYYDGKLSEKMTVNL